jgi:hypothetical protein
MNTMTDTEKSELNDWCEALAADTLTFRAANPELADDSDPNQECNAAFDKARSLDWPSDTGTVWCLWCPDCYATVTPGLTRDEAEEAPKTICPRCHRGVLEAQEE